MVSSSAFKFARALADVAAESKAQLRVAGDLERLTEVVSGNAELRSCLDNPAYPLRLKQDVAAEVARRLSMTTEVSNFLLLLVERGRHAQLAEIHEAYQQVLDEASGVVRVEVESAQALTPAEQARLAAGLDSLTGRQVRLNYRLEPELIAGVRVQIGSIVYDGSVRTVLEQLRRELAV